MMRQWPEEGKEPGGHVAARFEAVLEASKGRGGGKRGCRKFFTPREVHYSPQTKSEKNKDCVLFCYGFLNDVVFVFSPGQRNVNT
jgi:hypothetical protein